ncbi:hypothetical protein GCM10029963_28480 [Micromonospora andamanensis]|uniref:hypothetical protein n=1 Tax=Micromonospora andamanensis TaxID=1287068 RepID=UPI0019522AC7|nr:hypothetical protein [Micromonospora andamanensis]
MHDGNWIHHECVNASTADLDNPRWHFSYSYGADYDNPVDLISKAYDSELSRDVFDFRATQYGSIYFYHGLPGPADMIHVKAGQAVIVTADVRCLSDDAFARAYLGLHGWSIDDPNELYGGSGGEVAKADGWKRLERYDIPDVDTVWRVVLEASGDLPNPAHFRVANLRVTIVDGVTPDVEDDAWENHGGSLADALGLDVSTVADVSGVYPAFTGHVERWTQEYSGKLSTVSVQAVDPSSLLSQPLRTNYRAAVHNWHRDNVAGTPAANTFWYWPVVEAEENIEASPEIAGVRHPLTAVAATGPDGRYGFTGDKTMVWADGETSGSFVSDGDQPLPSNQGGALVFVKDSRPRLPSSNSFTVDFWYRCLALNTNSTPQHLFGSSGADSFALSGRQTWASIQLIGWAPMRFAFTARLTDGSTIGTGAIGPTIQVGGLYHVGMRVEKVGATVTVRAYVNGVLVQSVNADAGETVKLIPPSHASFMANMDTTGNAYQQPARGLINHCVIGLDIPTGFHEAVHAFGADPIESEADRLNRLLDAVGWSGSRNLDGGVSSLMAARWDADADGHAELGAAAEAASGTLFMGAAGEIVYHNRRRRMGVPVRWSVDEWTGGLRFELDADRIANVVRVERVSGLARTARDEASVSEYGPKYLTVRRDVEDAAEIESAAYWLLHRYREASPRCDTLRIEAHTLNGPTDGDLLGLAYGAAVSDRLVLSGLPEDAPADSMAFFVEGIEGDFVLDGSVLQWVTTLSVSDADRSDAWVLEDDVSGLLDADSCVAVY